MSIGTTVVMAFRKARLFAIDHEAGIEIGAGIACFAVSVATAAKAALKTKKIMEEYNEGAIRITACEHQGTIIKPGVDNQQEMVQYTSADAKKDLGKLKRHTAGKLALTWTPCALGFAAGTGLVLRSHYIMVKSNLGLAAALKTAETALDDYRARVRNKIGEEDENNLFNGVEKVEKKVKSKDKNGKTVVHKEIEDRYTDLPISKYGRIIGREYVSRDADWDNTSDNYNHVRVKQVEDAANRKLRSVGKVTLNDVYEGLGLEGTDDGDVVGWRAEWAGGKTPIGGIEIKILDHLLKGDPNAVTYVHDDWTDSMVRAADPFFVDFNVEGLIIANSTLKKLRGE